MPDDLELLLVKLRDENMRGYRGATIAALAESDDPRAVDGLIAYSHELTDTQDGVHYNAAENLIQDALMKISKRGVENLVRWLDCGSPWDKAQVAFILGKAGDCRAFEPLVKTLNDEDDFVCRCAADALGEIGDPRTAEALIAALPTLKKEALNASVRVLGQLADARAARPLIALMPQTSDPTIRHRVLESLGRIGGPEATPFLINFINLTARESSLDLRVSAVTALGDTANPLAIDVLVACLQEKWTPSAAYPYIEEERHRQWILLKTRAAEALGKIGDPQAAGPLLACLAKEHVPEIRAAAAAALGTVGDIKVVPQLMHCLFEKESVVRTGAARALASIGDRGSIDALIARLGDTDSEVRRSATAALSELGEGRLARAVWGVTVDDEEARRCLSQLISEGDMRALPPLADLARSEEAISENPWGVSGYSYDQLAYDRGPRCIALVKALGLFQDRRAAESLVHLIGDADDKVAEEVVQALVNIGEAAVPLMIKSLCADDYPVRHNAARVLSLRGPLAVAPVAMVLAQALSSKPTTDYPWGRSAVRLQVKACEHAIELLEAAIPKIYSLADNQRERTLQVLVSVLPMWRHSSHILSFGPRSVIRPLRKLVRMTRRML